MKGLEGKLRATIGSIAILKSEKSEVAGKIAPDKIEIVE
jgi:hypothetical protein